MCELDSPPCGEHRAEERRHRLPLRDRVRRDEGELAPVAGTAEQLERLRIPAGDVVQPPNVVPPPHVAQFLRLL